MITVLISEKEKLIPFYSHNRIWQGIPSIERTEKGRLFCTFYSGKTTETLGNYCVVLISDDDGKSWSEPVCATYAGDFARCYDPVLWLDPLKRLWFIWNKVPEFGIYASICEEPDADTLSWSDEIYIGRDIMINKPTVLSSGEWLFPVAVWNYNVIKSFVSNIGAKNYNNFDYCRKYSGANVYKTTDNGKTFSFHGGCPYITARNFDEHMIYERNDGVLVMHTRTNYGISRSLSYDSGATWTVAENSGIGGPCSRFHIRRLHSGRLLLINHYNFTGRNNLTALLSEDDGETFKYSLLLDERDSVSYPDMAESADGYLYIIYDRERGSHKKSLSEVEQNAREILMAKITEEDIIAGEVRNKNSFLKRIVTKLGKYEGDIDFFAHISPLDSESLLMEAGDIDSCLEKIFDHYPIHSANLHCVDRKKLDEIIFAIKENKGDCKELFEHLINLLSKASCDSQSNTDTPIVDKITEILKSETATKEINLSFIAEKLNMSVYYMCHIFKKKTGLSIIEYRDAIRFSLAKKLLVSSNITVTEICHNCGFASSSYFADKFKKSEGISPSAYRKLHKKAL